jgi:hypothetical protein
VEPGHETYSTKRGTVYGFTVGIDATQEVLVQAHLIKRLVALLPIGVEILLATHAAQRAPQALTLGLNFTCATTATARKATYRSSIFESYAFGSKAF